jgi:toxin ParE1/3/4
MIKIKYTNLALDDLEEIWKYTLETWSEKQADKYYFEIIDRCEELKFDFELTNDYSSILLELKGVKINRHLIFFRFSSNDVIEIVRILHEKMNFNRHLNI